MLNTKGAVCEVATDWGDEKVTDEIHKSCFPGEGNGGGGWGQAMNTTSFMIQVQGLVCEGKTWGVEGGGG